MPGRTSDTLKPGDVAPDFTLPGPDGTPVTRTLFQGTNSLLLHFFRGTWCMNCRKQMRQLRFDHAAFTEIGVTLLGVAVEKRLRLARWLAENPHPFPVLADEAREQARAWGVYQPFGLDGYRIARPATFFITPDQVIRYIHVGDNQFDRPSSDQLKAAVADALRSARTA